VTTASPSNTEYLKSIGATHVLDRRTTPEGLVAQLKAIEGLPAIEYAYDAIGDGETSFPLAVAAIASGGKVHSALPTVPWTPQDGKVFSTVAVGMPTPPGVILEPLTQFSAVATKLFETKQITVSGNRLLRKRARADGTPGHEIRSPPWRIVWDT